MTRIRVSQHKRSIVATVQETRIVDSAVIDEIEAELGGIVEKAKGKRIVIDFRNVSRMSSQMMTVLLRFNTVIRAQGGSLHVSHLDQNLTRIFRLTGLDALIS